MEQEPQIVKKTDTKFQVLAAVVDHWQRASFGPTVEEIREAVALSVRSSVQFHINDLVEQGYLQRIPRKHRTIRPTETGELLVQLLRKGKNEARGERGK